MLLSERIRHRLRQQGRAEGREEGREEGRAEERREFASAITAWYERQLERGEKFDEPPPGINR